MTTYYNKTDGLSTTTRKTTRHNSWKTQSPLLLRPPYPPTYTLQQNFTNIILMADTHNIQKGKMHSNCRLLPDHTKKQHKEIEHLCSRSQTLKRGDNFRHTKT